MSTQLTVKNHAKQLDGLGDTLTMGNVRTQEFIAFDIAHYVNPDNKSDGSLLTALVVKLNAVKSQTGHAVQKYIEAHCNAKLTDKDGVVAFRKIGKKTIATMEVLEVPFYEWEGNKVNRAKPAIGMIGSINHLAERITNGLADGADFKAFVEKDLTEAIASFTKAVTAAKAELLSPVEEKVELIKQ